jgi:CheY-like chemotaxis protein
MKILFADDELKLHVIIDLWLKRNNHQVTAVRNGKQALEQLRQSNFDCLISDVNMPEINGVELITKSLLLDNPPRLIILLTSRCDIEKLHQKLDPSRVHIFNKPFSPKKLTQLIEELDKQPSTTI